MVTAGARGSELMVAMTLLEPRQASERGPVTAR
jgi:hypothetical protein